jgi:urocanate hydratase
MATTCANGVPRGLCRCLRLPRLCPGFYFRDQFCEGRGPFRWVALSGDPSDIYKTDAALRRALSARCGVTALVDRTASSKFKFQGSAARICWLGYGERDQAGLLFNDMVRRGELSAPIVLGRDHLD